MSQIINITSEALQATIRRLLPSQQGFGEDLQASNVIMPVIDLTPTAEGSQLPTDLARAISFQDATTFSQNNSTSTVANTPGFYRIIGTSATPYGGGGTPSGVIKITDGLSTKIVWSHIMQGSGAITGSAVDFDFNVFLDTGESLQVQSTAVNNSIDGSVRQIADRYGNIQNPTGFTFE